MEKSDSKKEKSSIRCILHGSFRQHHAEIQRVHKLFTKAGIEIIAPTLSEIKSIEKGFALLESDQENDPRDGSQKNA